MPSPAAFDLNNPLRNHEAVTFHLIHEFVRISTYMLPSKTSLIIPAISNFSWAADLRPPNCPPQSGGLRNVHYFFGLHRRVKRHWPALGGRVTYAFDNARRRSRLIDPDNGRFTYGYDDADRMTKVVNPQNKRTTLGYDGAGRQTLQIHGNSSRTTQSYDAANRLTVQIQADGVGVSRRTTNSYDATGRRTLMNESGGTRTSWTYDNAGQLRREQRNGTGTFDVTHVYDPAGNRTLMIDSGVRTTATFDAANELLVEKTNSARTTYQYDANGNTTRKDTGSALTIYDWDARNRMTAAKPVGTPVTSTYDGAGKRVKKQVGAATKQFLYDYENLLRETDGSDNLEREYTSTNEQYGDLISAYDGSSSSYYEFDPQYSTEALLDDSGAVTDRYKYRAFGAPSHTTGSSTQPQTFVGKQRYYADSEVDLYILPFNIYDPATGRWRKEDEKGYRLDTPNLYAYCHNDPVNKSDPSGRDDIDWEYVISHLPERVLFPPLFWRDEEEEEGLVGLLQAAIAAASVQPQNYSPPEPKPDLLEWAFGAEWGARLFKVLCNCDVFDLFVNGMRRAFEDYLKNLPDVLPNKVLEWAFKDHPKWLEFFRDPRRVFEVFITQRLEKLRDGLLPPAFEKYSIKYLLPNDLRNILNWNASGVLQQLRKIATEKVIGALKEHATRAIGMFVTGGVGTTIRTFAWIIQNAKKIQGFAENTYLHFLKNLEDCNLEEFVTRLKGQLDAATTYALDFLGALTGLNALRDQVANAIVSLVEKIENEIAKWIQQFIPNPGREPVTGTLVGKIHVFKVDGITHYLWAESDGTVWIQTEKTKVCTKEAIDLRQPILEGKVDEVNRGLEAIISTPAKQAALVNNASRDCCAQMGFTYVPTAPSDGTWTQYVVSKCEGSIEGVDSAHGHHIVMKGDKFPENAKAREILCKYRINPFTSCANLVVSPNKCHSSSYAIRVLQELERVDKPGATKDDIIEALKRLAVVHKNCPEGGKVDPLKDDDPI